MLSATKSLTTPTRSTSASRAMRRLLSGLPSSATFKANAVIGSPDEPTEITFVQADSEDGKWYSVSGIQLPERPTRSGVYIFNGKKILIK